MSCKNIHVLVLWVLCVTFSAPLLAKSLLIEHKTYSFDKETKIHSYTEPRLKMGDSVISGDFLEYRTNENELHFSGNIVIQTPTVIVTADQATIHLKNHLRSFLNATLFDKTNNTFSRADKIEQVSEERFIISNGTITTCDPKDKAWEIRARKIVYQVDNFAYSVHTSIHLHSLPLFYTPYFSWPTKQGRATGLLTPILVQQTTSDKTKEYGPRLQVPYFIALDRDHDLTITADLIRDRGAGIGLEYNYAFVPGMRGRLDAWYLDETREDRSLADEELGTLHKETDQFDLRPTRSTYTFKHRQRLPLRGQLFLSIAGNSDNEVNKEYFNSTVTKDYYQKHSLGVVFPFYNGGISVEFQRREDFLSQSIYDTSTDADSHLNKRPTVSVSQRFSNILGSPLSIDSAVTWTQYNRTYGWKGTLKQGHIRFGLPFYVDFLNIRPGYRRDFFGYTTDYTYRPGESPNSIADSSPDSFGWSVDTTSLELSFETFRYFTNSDRVRTGKLSIVPRLIVESVEDVDQTRASYPAFINKIYSRKSETHQLDILYKTKNPATGRVNTFFSLRLSQIYDHASVVCQRNTPKTECPLNHSLNPEVAPGEQKLPLRINLTLSPTPQYAASLFYRFDHIENRVIETQADLSLNTIDGNRFSLNLRNNTKAYNELDNTSHNVETVFTIAQRLRINDLFQLDLSGSWDQNRNGLTFRYAKNQSVKRLNRQMTNLSLALTYQHSCYNFMARYNERIVTREVKKIITEELEQKLILTFSIPILPISVPGVDPEAKEIPLSKDYYLN